MISPFGFDFAGNAQKLRDIRDLAGEVVITFSVVANFMPKVTSVTNPVLKRIVSGVSFLALNWRTHLRGATSEKK